MVIRPILLGEDAPFLEESCALCKEPFTAGEKIVVCPDDATRHHVLCWQMNNNRCTAYGCTGRGEVGAVAQETEVIPPQAEESVAFRRPPPRRPPPQRSRSTRPRPQSSTRPAGVTEPRPGSKVRTLPSSTFGCAQGCMVLAVALAIVLMSVSCFGLWAIMDYLMLEVFGLSYREPLTELFRPGGLLAALALTFSTIPILR